MNLKKALCFSLITALCAAGSPWALAQESALPARTNPWHSGVEVQADITGPDGSVHRLPIYVAVDSEVALAFSGKIDLKYERGSDDLIARAFLDALDDILGERGAVSVSWSEATDILSVPGDYTIAYSTLAKSLDEKLDCYVYIDGYGVPLSDGQENSDDQGGMRADAPAAHAESEPQLKTVMETKPVDVPAQDASAEPKASAEPAEPAEPAPASESAPDAEPVPASESVESGTGAGAESPPKTESGLEDPSPAIEDVLTPGQDDIPPAEAQADENDDEGVKIEDATEDPGSESEAPNENRTKSDSGNDAPQPQTHIVRFMDRAGEALMEIAVADGDAASKPKPAELDMGEAFKHWSLDRGANRTAYDFAQAVTADLMLWPVYEEVDAPDPVQDVTDEEPEKAIIPHAWIEPIYKKSSIDLIVHAENLPADALVKYQWQNNESGQFEDVPGATGDTWTISMEDYKPEVQWRLRLTILAE